MSKWIQKAEGYLQGEPLRFIVYGAAAVVWVVVGVANQLGFAQLGPSLSLTDSMIDATAAAAILTELVHRYVSPATS